MEFERTLYENTPAMLHSLDRNGRLVSVSNYWLEKLGYKRREVIGRKFTEFLTEDSRRTAEEVVMPEYFRTGFGQDVPYQLVKKNGKLIDVLLSATAERGVSVVAEQERTLSFPRFLYQLNLPSIRGLKPLICRSISPYQLNPTSIGTILRNQV